MTVNKRYSIIYADPPWTFDNKNTGGSMKSGASSQYPTMTVDEICQLPVNEISDENCVLFMWWVGSMPLEALKVVEAWGFTLKTMTGFVWVKRTIKWKLFFGMGFWTRQGSENCLIATKGNPKRADAGIRSVIESVVSEHSKKPDVFRHNIVRLVGDLPRVELFARQKPEKWDVWGNEVVSDIIL